uniref:Uma2 family endonuclease n=1 Tax=Chroococcidiopsis sp. TS-821 TaxID=1378066 RepID=UPI002112FCAF|nr:Uma2 family endonuclease [Chroococcidiopsis sp. TS-821]
MVEVDKTRIKKDVEIKAAIYATAAIQEYWVLDLSVKEIIVFRNPQAVKYTEEYTIQKEMITPLAFADVTVSVEKLLT